MSGEAEHLVDRVVIEAADPGGARLEWSIQHAPGPYAAVYRRQPGTPWSSIATLDADASGAVSFEDHSVMPGGRYGYMITVPSEQGQAFIGEAWVDVPSLTGVTLAASIATLT